MSRGTIADMLFPWPAPPRPLRAEPGWVHVFRFALDPGAERTAVLHSLLTEDEQQRAARYIPEDARQQFITARGQMRTLLGEYLGQPPQSLRFDYNAQNKPGLPESGLCFNLSHSAGLGLLAVTAGQEVGVDVESALRRVDYPNIARRFFAPSEAAQVQALPPEAQPRAFFTIWTRKEAYIKACGGGLSIPLASFTVSADLPARINAPARSTAPARITASTRITASDPGWSIHDIQPGPDYAAALVVQGAIQGLRLWAWE